MKIDLLPTKPNNFRFLSSSTPHFHDLATTFGNIVQSQHDAALVGSDVEDTYHFQFLTIKQSNAKFPDIKQTRRSEAMLKANAKISRKAAPFAYSACVTARVCLLHF